MSTPTTIATITPDQFAARMAALFPPGWSSAQAKSPGGAVYAMLKSIGTGPASEMLALQYVDDATRLQTAQGQALDIAGVDYFGIDPTAPVVGLPPGTQLTSDAGFNTTIYALPRLSGETDAAYSARLMASLLPTGATRPAVTNAITTASGGIPRVVEPWRPLDTGVWDPLPGTPMAFWDVDNGLNPFRWTDQSLSYQGFVNCLLPSAQPFGPNPTPCYDTIPFFWDVPNQYGIYFIDPPGTSELGETAVYNAINRAKCEGTIVWVQFTNASQLGTWDDGLSWDESGVVWG